MIVSRRRDSPLEIVTGCASIRTTNRTRTTIETKRLTRRAAMTETIEGIEMIERKIQDRTEDKAGLLGDPGK